MTTTEFRVWLNSRGACSESLEWLGDRTAEQAWGECERADWLLWWAARAGVERKLLVRCACACARRPLRFVPRDELRPLRAIETAEAWCDGKASIEDVRHAARAADAAADAAAYAAAAARAAYAEAAEAEREEHLAMCKIVREMIPFPGVAA